MDRLAKKCVIASSVLHGTLVVVLLVGPAFLKSQEPVEAQQIIDFIPFKTLESSMSGGGNPNVEQTIPKELPKPQPQEQAKPAEPKPPVREQAPPQKREEPKKTEPVKADLTPAAKEDDAGWKPTKPKISLKQVTRGSTEKSSTPKSTSRNTDRAESIKTAISKIQSAAPGGVNVELRGPGGGGIPYAGFNDALVSAYMRAWLIPSDAADETSRVVVKITLRRDGTVISSQITSRSGNSALDASVQRALDKVTFVAPFPDSVKDAQKSFWLQFDPRAKRMMG